MDRILEEKLKISLNKSVYHHKTFNDQMMNKTIERLSTNKTSSNRKPLFLASFVSIVLFCMLSLSQHINSPTIGVNEFSNKETSNMSGNISDEDSVNYLFITDVEESRYSILLNINKKTDQVTYTNIPLNVKIENKTFKLNTKEEINNALGIEIHTIYEVTPEKLGEYIESINGVKVKNPFAFDYNGDYFPKGVISLKYQDQVINYLTMRYQDPDGDVGRNERIFTLYKELFKEKEFFLTVFDVASLSETDEQLITSNEYKAIELSYEGNIIDGQFIEEISHQELEKLKQFFSET